MKIKMEDVYRKAIEWWGMKAQLDQLLEELGELIVATRKFDRHNWSEDYLDNLCEELADVEIMIQQFKYLYPDQIEKWKIIKLVRLMEKLENEEKSD